MTVYRQAIDLTTVIGRERWLNLRKPNIGASEVGALFGVHDYISALRLYVEKRGVEFPDKSDNPFFRRGRWFEPAVGVAVREQRPDWIIVAAHEYFWDGDLHLGCTPDFYIHADKRGRGVLQAKTGTRSVFERWQENGPPFWITLQALTEAMLVEAAFAATACVLIDAYDPQLALFEFARHAASEEKIRDAVARFWSDVAAGIEPGPDFGKDAELLKILAPRERAKDAEIDLSSNNELPGQLARRAQLKAEMKVRQDECDLIDTEIKYLMRDAAVAQLPDWRISYRTAHYGPREAYDARKLHITDLRPESENDP